MAQAARIGHGCVFSCTTSQFTCTLMDITVTPPTRDSHEKTNMSSAASSSGSPYKEFVPGAIDPGGFAADVVWDPDIIAPLTDYAAETMKLHYAVESGGTAGYITFTGFATVFGATDLPVNGVMRGRLEVKVTGAITETASA